MKKKLLSLLFSLASLALASCGGSNNVASSGATAVSAEMTIGGTYTVSPTVSGLVGTVVLQDNGGDNLSVSANGVATFSTALATGATYAVTVLTQPSGSICNVSNGTGTISSANVTNVTVVCSLNIITAAYWDNWSSSISIPNATLQVLDIVYGAFGSWTSTTADSVMLSNFQQACTANPNVKLFLAVGGSNGGAPTTSQVPQYVTNVMGQVSSYNASLVGCKIYGVGLDLENGTSSDTISDFASGFKSQGLQVSVAPQAYNSAGSGNVSSASPTNFSLTSGGSYYGGTSPYNQYGPAVASGNVNYIMLQTYNTSNWTIDNCDESMTCFISAVATAMANLVQTQSVCTVGRAGYNVCIPSTVTILIGEPANCASASFSIFTTTCTTSGQTTSLSALNTAILSFPSQIGGVATWELAGTGDYVSSSSSTVGAFSATIFGAPAAQ